MEFYRSDVTDPTAFVGRPLAETFAAQIGYSIGSSDCGGMFDAGLFAQFCAEFNCVDISSGLPKNNYGQTVRLLQRDNVKLVGMEWLPIPDHLIGEGMSFKPTQMTGRFSYRNNEDRLARAPFVEEFFFFEFQPGYHPSTFSEFDSFRFALRYLSDIVHNLDLFGVVLLENGVYVSLRARTGNTHKPAFAMNS